MRVGFPNLFAFAVEALLLAALRPAVAFGQEFPPSAELDSLAAAAQAAPLFASDAPLRITLVADMKTLVDERPDSAQLEGVLRFGDPGGGPAEVPVKVRTRGNFRRDKRNCSFPPIRLNVPKKAVEGTVLDGQDKLKLVSPCRAGRDNYQQLVYEEYLIYRTLLLLTPVGFRVRMLEITFEDSSGEEDPLTAHSFVIEDDDQMAIRNRGVVSEWEQFHPANMDGNQASLVALFQYMIGNTDWSAPLFHNMVMIRTVEGSYMVVPYDFDFSGMVDAPYAAPDPSLPIRDVRDRIYRGFCRPDVDQQALIELFRSRRPAITALWEGYELLEDGRRSRALDYLETFYRVLDSPARYRVEIERACRRMPS